jgi:hypothetical protein
MTVAEKSEDKNLTSINSRKKDSREEDKKEREEATKKILDEDQHISKDTLDYVLSLPVERKISKVSELLIFIL